MLVHASAGPGVCLTSPELVSGLGAAARSTPAHRLARSLAADGSCPAPAASSAGAGESRRRPVTRSRQRIRDVGVQALQLSRVARAADPPCRATPRRRGPCVPGAARAGSAAARRSHARDRLRESGSAATCLAPALDAAGGLEPRDGGHEMAAGEVVRRRERLAVLAVRRPARSRPAGPTGSGRRRGGTLAAHGRAGVRRRRRSSIAEHLSELPSTTCVRVAFARRHALMPLTMNSRSPGSHQSDAARFAPSARVLVVRSSRRSSRTFSARSSSDLGRAARASWWRVSR